MGELESVSGDAEFDRSLRTMVEAPLPGAPALPRLPAASPEVVTFHVFVGNMTQGTTGSIRFAAHQTPSRLAPGSLRLQAPLPRGTRVTVKYNISEVGRVNANSIRVLNLRNPQAERAIQDALTRAIFDAPTSNCRAIAQTVVQTFTF